MEMTKPTIEVKPNIILNEQDVIDLLTNRAVHKGGIIIKVDNIFFLGFSTISQVVKKVYDILNGARI